MHNNKKKKNIFKNLKILKINYNNFQTAILKKLEIKR